MPMLLRSKLHRMPTFPQGLGYIVVSGEASVKDVTRFVLRNMLNWAILKFGRVAC
jgi:hypothetical protein